MAYKTWNSGRKDAPWVIIHSFVGDGTDIWEACQQMECPKFNMIAFFDLDFDDALTPWPAKNIRNGLSDFGGKSREHLEYIYNILSYISDIQDKDNRYILVGYSLAGLFSLWAATQSDIFCSMGCVSGSLWYPELLTYLQGTSLSSHLNAAYFSLGDKESKTRHPLLSQVDSATASTVKWAEGQPITVTFEMNPGNHFTAPDWRMAKAIKWLLQHS